MSVTACSAEPERPAATTIVQEYLDAIALGDFERARTLDLIEVDTEFVDDETLMTNAVGAGARRIEDVVVSPDTTKAVVSGEPSARAVNFTATLDGEQLESFVPVVWDEDDAAWRIVGSLAEGLYVDAHVNSVEIALIGFSVPGAEVPARPDDGVLEFLAYPGVYAVTADLDPSLLVDPALGTTHDAVVGIPGTPPTAEFEVTALP